MTHRSLSVTLSSVTAKSMFRITWRCVFVNMQSMRKCCSVRAECVHNLRVGDAQSRRWSRSRTTEYAAAASPELILWLLISVIAGVISVMLILLGTVFQLLERVFGILGLGDSLP